jgi:hypothetical protein
MLTKSWLMCSTTFSSFALISPTWAASSGPRAAKATSCSFS